MCCLFGLMDPRHSLSGRQKARLLRSLSIACEARGTDATGIAYRSGGRLRIHKKPLPAHQVRFFLPDDAHTVMGSYPDDDPGQRQQGLQQPPLPRHRERSHLCPGPQRCPLQRQDSAPESASAQHQNRDRQLCGGPAHRAAKSPLLLQPAVHGGVGRGLLLPSQYWTI